MRNLYSPSLTSVCTFCGEGIELYWFSSIAFQSSFFLVFLRCVFSRLDYSRYGCRDLLQFFTDIVSSSMMLKFQSLPLKVIFVHLSMASSILLFQTHFSVISRSSYVSRYDFLIESSFKLSAKMTGSEKFRTSGRSFINIQNSNGPKSKPWGTPLVTSRVLELHLSILTNCLRFSM